MLLKAVSQDGCRLPFRSSPLLQSLLSFSTIPAKSRQTSGTVRLCLCYSQRQSRQLRLLFRLCLTAGTLLNPLPYLYTLFLVTYVTVNHLMMTVSTENIIEATWKDVNVSSCS